MAKNPAPRKVATVGTVDTSEVNDTNNSDAGIGAGRDVEASGAIIEDGAKDLIDFDSPAVDNNPRAGTSKAMNQIDFNDPTKTQEEAVIAALGGSPEKAADKSADD